MPKIETYDSATTLDGTEDLILVQAGESAKTTPEQLRQYAVGASISGVVDKTLNSKLA